MTIQAVPYELTKQGIFDFVYKFIVKQGRPSLKEDGVCAYRAVQLDGTVLQCAAGCLLSDDEAYGLPQEDTWDDVEGTPVRLTRFHTLILRMQCAHDDNSGNHEEFISEFKDDMAKIASEYGLKVPNVDV